MYRKGERTRSFPCNKFHSSKNVHKVTQHDKLKDNIFAQNNKCTFMFYVVRLYVKQLCFVLIEQTDDL